MSDISDFSVSVFENFGFMGLYGGLQARDIRARKRLKSNQKILDYMGYTELAANLFRITQTEEKLKREGIIGEDELKQTYLLVGEKVRQTILELGGTMPEDFPASEKTHETNRSQTLNSKKSGEASKKKAE